MFWIASGALCLVVAVMVVLAARRPTNIEAPAAAYDLRVYRDQLAEIDRDVARGIVTEDEAERARTEVSRRILEADRALQREGHDNQAGKFGLMGITVALGISLVGAFGVYSMIGAPGYADLPLATRIDIVETARANRPDQATAEAQAPQRPRPEVDPERLELVEQLRGVMELRTGDVEGLTLLAANEAMLGNFRAAHNAQSRLLTLLGEDATGRHWIDYAEMMIFAAGGYVSPEAEEALLRGLELEPRDGTARYYAGEMYAQQGRPDLALPIWSNLLGESRPDAPWVEPIQLQISSVARAAGAAFDPAALPQPSGPTAADIAAAQGLSPDEQREMIEGMVSGLADRLATEGGTPQDWAQLITAYGALGRSNAAQIVHDDAQSVFADAPEALALIDRAFRAAMAQAGQTLE
ncbi:c-type cytochrome biogenesis protein CcmI [Gymnodinialimonas sp. 2305UL16-5]|uniref:c-type cytochrome biogenesis protein CcmI n=1 Tax=Gymnodinialimonas mytili TaxID=3126503 RepID=UPI0030A87AA0